MEQLTTVEPEVTYAFDSVGRALTPDEVLVSNGHGSDPQWCRDVMHTAFDLSVEGAVPRHSIEARYIAFFD